MGATKQRASGLIARAQGLLDNVVSPNTRQQFYDNVTSFAHAQPLLFSFLLIQFFLSFTPVLLFVSFVTGTVILSLISATLFSLFWIGVALLLLTPTLFVTIGLGLLIWTWAASSFLIARWVYTVLPVSVKGVAEVDMPSGKTVVVKKTGEGYGDIKAEVNGTNGY
ncbi:hypothetical protein PVAG01_09684 [Phlyctema vagabunda]|uniref:Uncharacterized protein n=1 Tax=Phlyctema vagabunda TaxID=108571 RepID=A0ABR4P811_9HELO